MKHGRLQFVGQALLALMVVSCAASVFAGPPGLSAFPEVAGIDTEPTEDQLREFTVPIPLPFPADLERLPPTDSSTLRIAQLTEQTAEQATAQAAELERLKKQIRQQQIELEKQIQLQKSQLEILKRSTDVNAEEMTRQGDHTSKVRNALETQKSQLELLKRTIVLNAEEVLRQGKHSSTVNKELEKQQTRLDNLKKATDLNAEEVLRHGKHATTVNRALELQKSQLEILKKSTDLNAAEVLRQGEKTSTVKQTLVKQINFQQQKLDTLKQMIDLNAGEIERQGEKTFTVKQTFVEQINFQQQKLDTLKQMIDLNADEIVRQGEQSLNGIQRIQSSTTEDLEALEVDLAKFQSRAKQAAYRDLEIAGHVDDLREQFDASKRNGPQLPSSLRELSLPTRFTESPIVHYGQLALNFNDFEDTDSNFGSPVYFPRFLMQLNEQVILDVNPLIKSDEISLVAAEVDWHLHDNLSLVFGRFYSPLGFFGERLQTGWVWKTVDIPLMFNQVHPTPSSINGIMARGAAYIDQRPIKLEYAAFIGNGLSIEGDALSEKDVANLALSRDSFNDVNNSKAVGGRVGVSFPEAGVIAGMSGMANGAYDSRNQDDLTLWGVDFSYHRGNWDFRWEYMQVDQQTTFGPTDREGMYAQLAFRDYKSLRPIWQKTEFVTRVDYVDFDGIDLGLTGLDFGGRELIPVDRDRWLAEVNFYPYPSLVVKVGYEILNEHGIDELDDNGWVAQILWGF